MSWSWNNPTNEEAEEAYAYYKGKYNEAAEQKKASERQEAAYSSEKKAAAQDLDDCSRKKVNFEKRLRGIEDIIKMLEGSGGWFSTNVPETIEKAQKSIAKADASFRGSMRLSGGSGSASLEEALKPKTVDEDPHSSAALAEFKAEKARLEQAIEDLRVQIDSLSTLIDSLNKKIKACNAQQGSLQSAMTSYAYDMNHYKKYV